MKKKLLALLLVVCMILSMMPMALAANTADSGTCGEDLTWTLSSSGVLTISGTGDMDNYSSYSDEPWYSSRSSISTVIVEDGVTSIGSYAFYGCRNLTGITISDSVTAIGKSAFGSCDSLTSAVIPDSVTSIGSYAFSYCDALTSVTLPSGLTSIAQGLFHSCEALTTVTIPDGVTSIGAYAFDSCNALTTVTIPVSVTSIRQYAFNDCTSLTQVNYTGSETDWEAISISDYNTCLTDAEIQYNYLTDAETDAETDADTNAETDAETQYSDADVIASGTYGVSWTLTEDGVLTISGTGDMKSVYSKSKVAWYSYRESIQSVVITSGVTSIGNYAFSDCTNLTSVTIPASVTSIRSSAFSGCTSLTSITIPGSVTSIGSSAFSGCTSLTSITIPGSVTSIGGSAFSGCTGMVAIDVESDNETYCSVDGVLFNKSITELVAYPAGKAGTYTIPDSVTSIGAAAFSGCTGLTSVTIPDSVTSIGTSAFRDCTGLTSVTIPDSVTSIGEYAFRDCTGLTSVTIPDSVTSIGEYAFYGCDSLNDVFFGGTQAEWEEIDIDSYNTCLTSAVIHYSDGSSSVLHEDSSTVTTYYLGNSLYDTDGYRVIYVGDKIYWSVLMTYSTYYEGTFGNSNTSVARVSESSQNTCYIEGLRAGTCTITYDGSSQYTYYDAVLCKNVTYYGADSDSLDIRVIEEVTAITLDEDSITLTSGDSVSLGYTLTPTTTCANALLTLTYSSSDTSVVAVDKSGTLTAVNAGTATITATTSSGLTAICQVTVTDAEPGGNDADTATDAESDGNDSDAATDAESGGNDADTATDAESGGNDADTATDAESGGNDADTTTDPESTEITFTDVSSDQYYAAPVAWAVENGVTTGTTTTTFSPNDTCTRAMVVTFLWRAAGEPEPVTTVCQFTDVNSTDYYYKAVLWAVENGITIGTTDTTFSPNQGCTRAMVVTFLWRAAEEPEPTITESGFTDLKAGEYYETAALWAVENSVTIGTTDTTFSPDDTCTRAQIVTFLYRAYVEQEIMS